MQIWLPEIFSFTFIMERSAPVNKFFYCIKYSFLLYEIQFFTVWNTYFFEKNEVGHFLNSKKRVL
jgi:hypothetical protein